MIAPHSFRVSWFAASLLMVSASIHGQDRQGKPPNILYIMSDDHATSAVGAYQGRLKDFAPTPNIDSIARQGMRLNNVFCNNSICTPSRASIITGQYSHVNGIRTLRGSLKPESQSFVSGLEKAGYNTAVIGKWHIASAPRFFDHYEVLPGQGAYFNPRFSRNGQQTKYEGYCTDIITELSLDWLKSVDKEAPFFLMCHHKAPHGKWEYAPRHAKMFADIDIPMPPTVHDAFEHRSTALAKHFRTLLFNSERMRKNWPTGTLDLDGMSDEQKVEVGYQKYVKEYLRCVAGVDESVGRLLGYLEEQGLADDTIVIYTSDQGMFLGEHGYIDKRLILEESLRMPFLVRYPGRIEAGSANDAMIVNVDFAETILDYAGAEIPADMQGRSFRPLLEGRKVEGWRRSMFYAYWGGLTRHYGVRTERYKLLWHHTGERDFFDLQTDPLEVKSRIDDPEYADRVQELTQEFERLRLEVKIERKDLPGPASPAEPDRRRRKR